MSDPEYDSDASIATLIPSRSPPPSNPFRDWERQLTLTGILKSLPNGRRCWSAIPWDRKEQNVFSIHGLTLQQSLSEKSEASSEPVFVFENFSQGLEYPHQDTITQLYAAVVDVDAIVSAMKRARNVGVPAAHVLDWGQSEITNSSYITTSTSNVCEPFSLSYLRELYGDVVLEIVSPQIKIFLELLLSIGLWHSFLIPGFVYLDRHWNIQEIRGWEHCTSGEHSNHEIGSYKTMVKLYDSSLRLGASLRGVDLFLPMPRLPSSMPCPPRFRDEVHSRDFQRYQEAVNVSKFDQIDGETRRIVILCGSNGAFSVSMPTNH